MGRRFLFLSRCLGNRKKKSSKFRVQSSKLWLDLDVGFFIGFWCQALDPGFRRDDENGDGGMMMVRRGMHKVRDE